VLSAIHDLTLAGQFADRLMLVADGEVAATGPAGQVLRDDLLAAHFGAGVQVMTTSDGELAVISRRQPRRAANPGAAKPAAAEPAAADRSRAPAP